MHECEGVVVLIRKESDPKGEIEWTMHLEILEIPIKEKEQEGGTEGRRGRTIGMLHSRLGARWSDIDVTKSLRAGTGTGTFAGNRGPTARWGRH
jgi:hypothetical protein